MVIAEDSEQVFVQLIKIWEGSFRTAEQKYKLTAEQAVQGH